MLHVLLLAQWIGFPEAGFQNWVDSLAPDALCHAFQDGLIIERYLPGDGLPPPAAAETSRTRWFTSPKLNRLLDAIRPQPSALRRFRPQGNEHEHQ